MTHRNHCFAQKYLSSSSYNSVTGTYRQEIRCPSLPSRDDPLIHGSFAAAPVTAGGFGSSGFCRSLGFLWILGEATDKGGAASPAPRSLTWRLSRAEGYPLRRASDSPRLKPVFLSTLFHPHPGCVSCDRFASRREKTTAETADLVGKRGSPGRAHLPHASRLFQNHVVPGMGTVHASRFCSHRANPTRGSCSFQRPRLCGGGRRHTCSRPGSQGGLSVRVRVCLETLFPSLAQRRRSASGEPGVPRGASQHRPLGCVAGDVGEEFLSRPRMKLLIETGNKNNETARSQKSKDCGLERDCGEHLISSPLPG